MVPALTRCEFEPGTKSSAKIYISIMKMIRLVLKMIKNNLQRNGFFGGGFFDP